MVLDNWSDKIPHDYSTDVIGCKTIFLLGFSCDL